MYRKFCVPITGYGRVDVFRSDSGETVVLDLADIMLEDGQCSLSPSEVDDLIGALRLAKGDAEARRIERSE